MCMCMRVCARVGVWCTAVESMVLFYTGELALISIYYMVRGSDSWAVKRSETVISFIHTYQKKISFIHVYNAENTDNHFFSGIFTTIF